MPFFGIGKIKFKIPEVRVPKAPAGRAMPKPRVKKAARGNVREFSLTVFSSNKAPKGITHIDIIKALIETNGNRTSAGKKLGIDHRTVGEHAKNIRRLPDGQLAQYAKQLKITEAQIRQVCADLTSIKGINCDDVILALLKTDGNRRAAAKRLDINPTAVGYYAQKTRNLPDAELQKYAKKIGVTVSEIKRVCADLNPAKGVTRVEVIRTLIQTGGNRTAAGEKLRIHPGTVSRYAESIRRLPDAELQKYADTLRTTVAEIRRLCADLDPRKGITDVKVISALIATGGNRTRAAKKLEMTPSAVSSRAKSIKNLPDAKLQICAEQLKTTVGEIRRVCADLAPQKGITHIDIIKALLETNGSRTQAAKKLEITVGAVSRYAGDIRRLSDADLQEYAAKLKTTVDEIKLVCADLDPTKGVTYIEVIRALIQSSGNRFEASRKLRIGKGVVVKHAETIRYLPDAELQGFAVKLKTTVDDIRRACADSHTTKGITQTDVIEALFKADGSRKEASYILGISARCVSQHAQNIRRLPEGLLQEYAAKLSAKLGEKITAARIKEIVAPKKKGNIDHERRLQIIRALLKTNGNRVNASEILRIMDTAVCRHAQNIRRLSDAELNRYAAKLGTTAAQIRRVCANMDGTKGINSIDIIRALLQANGKRSEVSKKLNIGSGNVSRHTKNIRRLPDAELQKYAAELGITVAQIRRICADLGAAKKITPKDVIQSLIQTNGNRAQSAEKLGIRDGAVCQRAKKIRRLPEAELAQYAAELGVSVERIKQVCASPLDRAKKLFEK